MPSGLDSRYCEIRESEFSVLDLDDVQLAHLRQLSKDLAGSKAFWGSPDDSPDGRIIDIRPFELGRYEVKVHNAIGTIVTPGMTILVKPKIPMDHFVFIASRAFSVSARKSNDKTGLASGLAFHSLVCTWFLSEIETILTGGLARDYVTKRESLAVARGSIDVKLTALNWLRGKVEVESTIDDYSEDMVANRILKKALKVISKSVGLETSVTSRSNVLLRHFSAVGDAEQSARADTRNLHRTYVDALELAYEVIGGQGRTIGMGASLSKTFLFKTPDLIESGITSILNSSKSGVKVVKSRKVLLPSSFSVNPDLVIGNVPFTGDVKYKIQHGLWNRNDLGQAVLFATAFSSPRSLVVSFVEDLAHQPEFVPVGPIGVTAISWLYGGGRAPEDSSLDFISRYEDWLAKELIS
jgi:5-methylcytosine-specific restriction enzyme subunit McrC